MHNSSFSQWPVFAEDEREAALRPLLSGRVNYWTGQEGRAFEAEYAAYVGRQYGIAVANGTLALELALAALEIGPGDEVVTTCRTFIASASAITVRGARPVLCDVDTVSQNMTAETIRAVCTDRTKAVICVHLAGWPCDMDPILELAKDKGLWVIEDCAQAHGAGYKGRPVGSLGHMGAFSFCQDKIMSTGGEGGMLVLDDETLWRRAWSYKDHGKSWAAVYEREHAPGFRWLHETFGTNWRMTEMQAAIGRVQLGKLSDWVLRRRQLAARLTETFQELPGLRVTVPGDNIYHAYYKYYVFVRPEKLGTGWDRDRIISEVTSRGVPCMSGICPEIYLEQAFEAYGAWSMEHGEEGRLPVARELGKTSLMFLVHPTLTDAEIAKTCQMMSEVMYEAV